MAPVGAPVLEAALPEDQRGVPEGHQSREHGDTSGELLELDALLAAAVLVDIIIQLQLVDHHILSEPPDSRLVAGLEFAGEPAVLRNQARDSDV